MSSKPLSLCSHLRSLLRLIAPAKRHLRLSQQITRRAGHDTATRATIVSVVCIILYSFYSTITIQIKRMITYIYKYVYARVRPPRFMFCFRPSPPPLTVPRDNFIYFLFNPCKERMLIVDALSLYTRKRPFPVDTVARLFDRVTNCSRDTRRCTSSLEIRSQSLSCN